MRQPEDSLVIDAAEVRDGSIGGIALVALAWRRVLVFGIVGALAAAIIAILTRPVFRAEVTLLPATHEESSQLTGVAGGLGGLASLVGVNLPSTDNETDRAIAVLRSRRFTDSFIRDNGLQSTLCVDCRAWWRFGFVPKPTIGRAYKEFNDEVRTVKQDKSTGLVTLTVDWFDPNSAAQWANELIAQLNRAEQLAAIDEATKSINFLNQQLDKTHEIDMRQLLYHLVVSKTGDIMLAAAHPQYAFTVIDPAIPPDHKFKPQRFLLTLTGFILGLMGGAGYVLGRAKWAAVRGEIWAARAP